ncbi:vitronectin a [Cheilinus undulatus]|uniref:vitronectin a n=1 Tax=Cheilinus undulatus TaxID=241271 RepID=UPI001BD3CDDB|nr:vitronectin a [Cheilinus undulatus]XP_041652153.1 vitronectin a [Cheilinus undulatus]
MRLRAAALLLALLTCILAADESCMDRCENGFDSQRSCQCDSMCKYYKSCCSDFEVTCGMMTRGDTFVFAEDDDEGATQAPVWPAGDRSSTSISRQQGPTQRPFTDFGRRHQQRPETTLEMTRPPRLIDAILQNIPVIQEPLILQTAPPTQEVPDMTKPPPETEAAAGTTTVPVTAPTTQATTQASDPDAEICSERPFDAFMQAKNGSIYAFRGDYFFELDQKTVLPGYPKLIKDVWGISGPIDAAFTRINCQGKTYIFKGNKYWRFDNGVLDEDYPRDINVGFDKIPDHVDAAFALPAPGHNGKEKVYFFKGDQYHTYEFLHQPSHEECISMSERSPSTSFRLYTDVYYNNYERFFSELFSNLPQHHDKHHFIDKDWKGLKSPLDAAMAGRIYVTPWRSSRYRQDYQPDQQWGRQQYQQYGQQWDQQYGQQWDRQYGQQWGRRRQNRSPFWESMAERGMNMGQQFAERGMEMGLRLAERRMEMEERFGRDWDRDRRWDQDWDQDRRRDSYRQNNRGNYDSRGDRSYWDLVQRRMPIQSVYFFKGAQYYRVDLRTKRVDPAMPPYPRSIAKYWLGCSGTPGAEK